MVVQGPNNHIFACFVLFQAEGKMIVIAVLWPVLCTGQCDICTLKTLHTFNHLDNLFSVANSLVRRVHTCLGSEGLQSSCLDGLGLDRVLTLWLPGSMLFFF